jgi:hypothetical protein
MTPSASASSTIFDGSSMPESGLPSFEELR